MRHHPSCWNKVLAKLGFRRVLRPQHRAAFRGRLSRIENLEARQMMTVTVNTLADVEDNNPLITSLREAIAHPTDHSIDFDPSLQGGRIVLTQGELSVSKSVTITGPGADKLAIDAAGASRVMAFWGASNISNVSGLTITGGNSIASGGGIYVGAQLTLTSVDVSNNITSNVGGGIAVENGKLHVFTSTIHDNRAINGGGGIGAWINAVEAIKVVQSTISNNAAPNGAGLSVISTHAAPANASVLFSRSTITQNTASNGIGGIGGGVYNVNGATITSHGSIIAGNTAFFADNSDIWGAFNLGSTHNLIGRPGNSGLTTTLGNRAGTNAVPLDPKLSPLDNHGGPTKTHVPLPGSPAIDNGGPFNATYSPPFDQRGFDRRADRLEQPNVFPDPECWEDIGAVELSAAVEPVGDFNGDGREDQLIFDETTRALNVAVGAAASGNYDVESWGVMLSEVSINSTFFVGDFNGDGRDDLLIKSGSAYHLAISDGTVFVVQSAALPTTWNANTIYTGDFDGDGSDEILGGTASNAWSVAHYRDALGLTTAVATPSLNGFAPAFQQFFQDVNRDGRKDVITRASGSSPWMVRLAGAGTDGSINFTAAADWSAWIGYGYDAATGKLDADKAMAKVIEEFAWVYNNVELELYPGLMKGPEATQQTKAGNNWDQAALLEEKLQALGLGDVKIASGKVRASVSQISAWLGLKNGVSASAVLEIVRGSFDDLAQLVDASTTIEFTHAWVQANLPTATGFALIDLDPSWKFKDRQAGIPLIPELDSSHTNLSTGVFDEFSYLTLNPTVDRRLPLEFFEDQIMAWLGSSTAWQGNSLAEVPYDGPIKAKQFETLPSGFNDGMTLAPMPGVVQYSDFNTIADDPVLSSQLTHRVTISLRKNDETAAHWTHDLVVPSHSLETIQVTFSSSSATGVMADPNSIATAGPYYSRLVVNGSVVKWAAANESFAATDAVKIELLHLAPTSLVDALIFGEPGYVPPSDAKYAGPTSYDRKIKFTEKPGNILAFGLEANQYSRDSLANLQAAVLAAVAGKTAQADLIKDIDLLSSYAIAKYWHDYQSQGDAIVGLMGAVGLQQWVGSGRISSKPALLLDPTGGAGDVVVDYLAFGMAPVDFGIDLPNSNNGAIDVATGMFHSEAWQLLGYNSSALEHNVVEEITSADSVSTIKGLQRASQQNLGVSVPGDSTPAVTDDVISVFESRPGVGDARNVYHVYNIRVGSPNGVQVISPAGGQLLDANSFSNLLSSHNHNSATQIDDTLWAFLSNQQVNQIGPLDGVTGVVKAMATKHRTKVDSWTGSVYLTDIPGKSMLFAIQPDGGNATNGGYSGGVTKAPPPELKAGNFLNASWAGDPVNVGNGNMFRDETDIGYPNLGVPLTFSRHYDSQSNDDFGMGVGWMYSFGDVIYTENDPDVSGQVNRVWLDSQGRRHVFEPIGTTGYKVPSGLQGQVVFTSGAAAGTVDFVFKSSDGTEYQFEKITLTQSGKSVVGRLGGIVDRNGDGVAVRYTSTSSRTISHVHDVHSTGAAPARRLAIANPAGVITAVSKYDNDALLGTWNYAYSSISVAGVTSTQRLASVEAPAVAVADAAYVDSNSRPKVQYAYNNVANHYAKGLIDGITESDGSWHGYEYYRNRRVFRVMQSETAPPPITPPPPPPAPAFADLSGFIGLNNTSAPNNYTAGSTSAGGTFVDARSTGQGAAYLADTSLAVPGGILTATTPGGFSATGTLTFSVSSSSNPFFYFGFFDKDNPGNRAFGFLISDDSSSVSLDFHPAAGTVSPSAGDSVVQGTYTFEIIVNTDSSSPKVYLQLFDSSGQAVVYRTASIVPGSTPEADSFGFLQPALSNGSTGTFGLTISNVHYTGETLIAPEAPPEPPAAPARDVDVQTFNYNLVRNLTEFTDERGNVETYIHQKNGLLTRQIHADRSQTKSTWGNIDTSEEFLMTSTTDERGAVENFTYYGSSDPAFKRGQLKDATQKHYPNQTGLLTRYDFVQPDAANKPHLVSLSTVVVDPDSVVPDGDYYDGQKLTTTSQYYASGDAPGRLWKTTDAQGNVTEYSYYPTSDSVVYRQGLLKSIKQPAILDPNDPNGVATIAYETVFDYDAAGEIITTTTGGATTTTARYSNGQGMFQRTKDATNVVVDSIYDVLGRLRETGYGVLGTPTFNPIDAYTTKFKYDAMGRMRETTDPLGRVARFEYDRQGNVVKKINPDGTELLHEYDAFGNCIAKTDALGSTTRFVYDGRNRLVQTIRPDGAVERVRYDGAGNVVASIDALGNVTTFKYDAVGRLLETKLPDPDGPLNDDGGTNLTEPTTTNKYDKLGNLIETIDPEANVTQFKYDKLGRVVQTHTLNDPTGVNRTNPTLTAVTTLVSLTTTDYDAVGNVIETAAYDVSQYDATATATLLADPRAQQTPANIAANKVQLASLRYDAFGRPLKTINVDNTTTSATYDAAGRVRFQYDELNRVTEYRYDAFGRLDKTLLPDPTTGAITTASPTTSYRYDAAGNRIATIDPRGFTTRFEYDAFNRLTAVVDAQGNRSRMVYDVAGQMVATVDALGRASYTLYDKRGRAIEQRQADPDGVGPGLAPITRNRFDAAGRVVETIDALGYSTTYQYDNLGRVIKEVFTTDYQVVDADAVNTPAFTIYGGSATAVNQTADYGADSLLVSPYLLPNGTTSNPVMIWQFSGLGVGTYRVLASWTSNSSATTNLIYRLSDYYDETTGSSAGGYWPHDYIASGGDQRGATTDYLRFDNGSWNGWKQLDAGFEIDSNGPGAIGVHFAATAQSIHADAIRIERIESRSFSYDANGNRLTATDPLGRVTTYTYDELDRVVTETLPDPDANSSGNGSLISPLTTTSYDGYGNVASVLERRGNGANLRKTTYKYDARNRRSEEIFDADNGNVNVTYLNRKTTFLYDNVGNLTNVIELPDHATLRRRTYKTYDALNRLVVNVENADATSNVVVDFEIYSYDASSNVTRVQRRTGVDPRQIETLNRYDALGQLVEQTEQGLVNGQTEKRITRFQYDAVGQQIATIDPLLRVTRSEFDRLGRLTKSTDPDPDGAGPLSPHATTFAYDAAGQLLLKNNGANEIAGAHETDRYAYDPQGRLIRSEDGRGDVTTRRYDAAGNLVKLVDPADNATTYAYDNLDRMLTETTTAGVRQFIYDANGNLGYTVDRNGRAIKSAYTRDDQVSATWEYLDLAQAQVPNPGSQQFIAFTNSYYDALGRLEEERYARRQSYAQGPLEYRATDSYQYDGLDRLVEHSNQSIQTTNPLHSTGVPALKQKYAYAYDSSGLVETREQFIAGQFAASTKSTYNAFDELVRQEDKDVSAASVASAILDFESTDAAFAYHADGSLASTTRYTDWDVALPGGAGHRNRVETTYAYDGAGRLASIAHGQSRRTTATWPGNTQLVEFDYAYDAAGRINEVGTDWNTGLVPFSTRTDETQSFTFDAAGQLKVVDSNLTNSDASYNYGANGNRLSATEPGSGTDSYLTGTSNQVSQDSTYNYSYDLEGNLTLRQSKSDATDYETYAWDHRNRLTKVERYFDAVLAETVAYRYNAADELVYRSFTSAGQTAQVVHFLVESGQRTMTFEQDGDVLLRYQYGPTGEALFDQAFSGYGAPTLQLETDLRLPVSDHQNSTRVVMGHSYLADHILYVRQSIDYDPFGRVREVVRENAQSPAPLPIDDLDTIFAHHGSIIDPDSELYLKGERWYSPDLGRFVSEDPIQDGTNWFMFAGNDPVNYADPSGLSQQGHPLAGGYSGNVTRQPTIPSGNLFGGAPLSSSLNNFLKGAVNQALNPARLPSTTFGGFVDAGLGTSILSGGLGGGTRIPSVGSIANYQAAAPRSNGSRIAPAPSVAPQSPPTGFFQGLVNNATPYLPWRQAPLASAFGKFALDLNARNADGIVEGARATKAHAGELYSLGVNGEYRELANRHFAFNFANAAESDLFAMTTTFQFGYQGSQTINRHLSIISNALQPDSAELGRQAAPFTDFVATTAIGGGGKLVNDVGRLRVGLDANVLKSPQLNSGGAFNAIKIYLKRGPKVDPTAPHNATIHAEASLLEAGGNTIIAGGRRLPERLIRTPGGIKTGRRPDILFETANGQLRGRNIGHVDSAGNPITRELDALRDLNRVIPTDFIPF